MRAWRPVVAWLVVAACAAPPETAFLPPFAGPAPSDPGDTGLVDTGALLAPRPGQPHTSDGPGEALHHVVVAGDSYAFQLGPLLPDALNDRGRGDVAVSWQATAIPGTQAVGWAADAVPPGRTTGLLTALRDTLDVTDAGVLVLGLGGNDYLRLCADGWGEQDPAEQAALLDAVGVDLGVVVGTALADHPELRVVIVGYPYSQYDVLVARDFAMPHDRLTYNLGHVGLAERQRALGADPRVRFVLNLGWLQHTFGDAPRAGLPAPTEAYGPGVAPAPGHAPTWEPFPGGFVTLPGPASKMPDGLHLTADALRVVLDRAIDQGFSDLL